ncbi:hypothetical protein [Rhizobium laguerreae]|uniref:hypothetical protein n=1 Tax=Rhizobium laguerreae TaxID=1076926 RepID=UPI001C8FFC5F|nr:hypothetical protein [Rhizobium laguerreae]MBY3252492.1 hypothetical protein [Rhizobium laguerreae]
MRILGLKLVLAAPFSMLVQCCRAIRDTIRVPPKGFATTDGAIAISAQPRAEGSGRLNSIPRDIA